MKHLPLPAIAPFNRRQRVFRAGLNLIQKLSNRLLIQSTDRVGKTVVLLGVSFVFSPALLGVLMAIMGMATGSVPVYLFVVLGILSAMALALRWWWNTQPSLSNLGQLNRQQYAYLQAIGELHPAWKEHIIAWCLECDALDDRHFRACHDLWIKTRKSSVLVIQPYTGTCPLDMFNGEPRQRLEARERAQARREQLKTLAARNNETVDGERRI